MTQNIFALLQPQWQTLGEDYFHREKSQPLHQPYWLAWNTDLATELNLSADLPHQQHTLDLLSGSLKSSPQTPISTVYSGHQFGHYVPQLGDGRAMLMGDILDKQKNRWELQLKGSGQTRYSRFADGRAVLRSSIREYLCSEAMHGLGIPTTRALALTGSNDPIHRETIETSAIVTRLAKSFMRFGHFEFGYHQRIVDWVKPLADMAIQIDYPNCKNAPNPYQALFRAITLRSAQLAAKWQAVGFCHGVLNTDNISILGLTIDYGPFGFLDAYNPHHICNHSDNGGRYAYNQQPYIMQWNLSCLASTFLDLVSEADLVEILNGFTTDYFTAFAQEYRAKLGLSTEQDNDKQLFDDLLTIMHHQKADFTLTFRYLSQIKKNQQDIPPQWQQLFTDFSALDSWLQRYRQRLESEQSDDATRQQNMNAVNPKYILRNYILENTIQAAKDGNIAEIEKIRQIFSRPFDEQPEHEQYAKLPPQWAEDICISCSS